MKNNSFKKHFSNFTISAVQQNDCSFEWCLLSSIYCSTYYE